MTQAGVTESSSGAFTCSMQHRSVSRSHSSEGDDFPQDTTAKLYPFLVVQNTELPCRFSVPATCQPETSHTKHDHTSLMLPHSYGVGNRAWSLKCFGIWDLGVEGKISHLKQGFIGKCNRSLLSGQTTTLDLVGLIWYEGTSVQHTEIWLNRGATSTAIGGSRSAHLKVRARSGR